MRVSLAWLFMFSIIYYSCITLTPEPTSPEEAAYLKYVMAFPLTFVVSTEESEIAWGRIQSFIGKYSSMKTQTVTDYIIETYNPSQTACDFGYSVVRTIEGDLAEIEIRCFTNNEFCRKEANINAHILAHYARTGEINPKFIVR